MRRYRVEVHEGAEHGEMYWDAGSPEEASKLVVGHLIDTALAGDYPLPNITRIDVYDRTMLVLTQNVADGNAL